MATKAEELVCYIYGIDKNHEVKSIVVYKTEKSVRLLGPHGSHHVHSSNLGSLEGWKREAALVWNITDIVDVPRLAINSDSDKTTYERLKQKADERKRFAEEHAAKHSTS